MKNVIKICAVLVCFSLALCIGIFAADNTVYVLQGAESAGSGTSESPYNTFTAATKALAGNGGTIVLLGTTELGGTVVPEQSANLTITASGSGKITLAKDLKFAKNTNSNLITIDTPITVTASSAAIFGGFNSITFTDKCAVTGTLDFYGGNDCEVNDSAGWNYVVAANSDNQDIITEIAYNITVKGGTFRYFAGGNRRADRKSIIGSIAAPIEITVDGGTFGTSVPFTADSPIKNTQAFSISGMSLLADDATLVINGGTFNVPIYAQGYLGELCTNASGGSQITKSDKKYYALDGDVSISVNGGNINGCEISAFQNGSGYAPLLRGDFTLNVSDKATLASEILFDATQVKAYSGSTNSAKLIYPASSDAVYKRFDLVNGVEKTYEEPLRIACVGDSITQGYGTTSSSETDSYPAQLLTYLSGTEGKARIDGKDIIVANYGCSSTRVMDYGRQCYRDMLAFPLSSEETDADIVIIGLGTNDSLQTSINVSQHEHFKDDYETLLTAYGKCADTDGIYGTTAIYRGGKYALGAVSVRALQKEVLASLSAKDKRYVCVDLYALTLEMALDGSLLSSDQLHPGTAGYKLYMYTIADAIFDGKCTVPNFELSDIYISSDGKNVSACTKENPTNNMSIALARAGADSTLHVSGRVEALLPENMYCLFMPKVDSFSVVGETSDAAISTNGKLVQIQSDFTADKIELSTTATNSIMIQLGYNNVTLGKGFKTLESNVALLVGGYVSFSSEIKDNYYTTPEYVSSDKDCVINVNGGTYQYILGGNYLYYGNSKIGTYSGDMIFNIGENVNVLYHSYSCAAGMNYVTGSITMNVGSWADGKEIRDYVMRGDTPITSYEPVNNTGTVTINVASGVNAKPVLMCDFNGDKKVGLDDLLIMRKYMLNGDFDKSASYFRKSEIRLSDVAAAAIRLSK
ncbi:MAG: hypothetical protein IKU61_07220 [Clostridia bacterium]|nr:hypothetical protein [Clostridia bacterium]